MLKGNFDGIPEANAKCSQISERISYLPTLIVRPERINLDTLKNHGPQENRGRIQAHAVSPSIYQNRT